MRETKKIRDSAKGRQCTVRLPGCTFDTSTTVYAHLTGIRFGHGIAKKTNLGAYCDHFCHDVVDGRIPMPSGMEKDDVDLAFYAGVLETTQLLLEEGLLKYA